MRSSSELFRVTGAQHVEQAWPAGSQLHILPGFEWSQPCGSISEDGCLSNVACRLVVAGLQGEQQGSPGDMS